MTEENPLAAPWLRRLTSLAKAAAGRGEDFPGSGRYWEERYAGGGSSGRGSSGRRAARKARILNDFVRGRGVRSVIEFGCGDGRQLLLARYPRYLGFDVSPSVLKRCREVFTDDPDKSFRLMDRYDGERADLALSLDVIYHLVEEDLFESYMERLFSAGERFVIIYSSNTDSNLGFRGTHIRHRLFTKWVEEHAADWALKKKVPGWPLFRLAVPFRRAVSFYMYERTG
jgi:SAM-dependent methyltransferase